MEKECEKCGEKGFIEKELDYGGWLGKSRLIFPCESCEIFQGLFSDVYINKEANLIRISRRKLPRFGCCPDVLLELELNEIDVINVEIGVITGNKETFLKERAEAINVLYRHMEDIDVLTIDDIQCVCIEKGVVLEIYKFMYPKSILNLIKNCKNCALPFYGDSFRKEIAEVVKE